MAGVAGVANEVFPAAVDEGVEGVENNDDDAIGVEGDFYKETLSEDISELLIGTL